MSEHPLIKWIRNHLPALTLALQLAVLGPAFVYFANPGEFQFSFSELFIPVLGTILLALFLILIVVYLFAGQSGERVRLFLMFLVMVTYLHGNLLLWDTGVLDGSTLDLQSHWRSLVDLLLWMVIAGLVIKQRRWMLDYGWAVCIALLLFQGADLLQTRSGNATEFRPSFSGLPGVFPGFSTERNVIHLVLDGFQGSTFSELLLENPHWQASLDGFTFFADATTPSDVTYLSVPAFLTGQPFRNEQPISAYHDKTLGGRNLYPYLNERGYQIEVATPLWWNGNRGGIDAHYLIPRPYKSRTSVRLSQSVYLLDLSLFRQAPHFLMAGVYRSGTWLLSSLLPQPELQFEHFSQLAFLRDLTASMEPADDQGRYKFLHLVTPHPPLVSAPDCQFSGKELEYRKAAFKTQSRCTLEAVLIFLEELKSHDLYRHSLILIHGDHGSGIGFPMKDRHGNPTNSDELFDGIRGGPQPLVLIKPPGATGLIRSSLAPVALTDIPATVSQLLALDHDWPGRNMFEVTETEQRVRHFYTSTMHRNDAAARDQFDEFRTLQIEGSIFDMAAWEDLGTRRTGSYDSGGHYTWSTRLSFGRDGTAKRFMSTGWSVSRLPEISWTASHRVSFKIPLNASPEESVVMRANLKPFIVPGHLEMQRVTIRVTGSEVARLDLAGGNFRDLEVPIPSKLLSGTGPTDITFELPDATTPESLGVSDDRRALGLAFRFLSFEPLSQDQPPGSAPGPEEIPQ